MTFSRLCRLGLLASATTALPAAAQQTPAIGAAPPVISSWLTQGSDIPADPAWTFGVLPNGLRYAVRRSTRPAEAISIRVRIGVGGLMEADDQQGWSHLIEHMVFRGTAHYADGEGIRLWQRLGANFGSDTNAHTTLTATSFELDLPRADVASYAQAMSVVAEMMDSARFDPALLATERHVVEAERAQRLTPLARTVKDAQQPLFYAGTKAASRDVIGTSATLAGANAGRLRAYYEAWYRPDNAVVVVAGDADPAVLEAEVRRAFGGWKRPGKLPTAPDWGAPAAPPTSAAVAANPQAPALLMLDFISPHVDRPITAARQQEQFAQAIAVGILNQRLSSTARKGGAILNAGSRPVEQRHIEDQLLVQVQPQLGQWQAALSQTYTVLNGLLSTPPAQSEIDEQAATVTGALTQGVRSATTRTAPALANSVIAAVEEADVAAAPDFYARLFAAQRRELTPAAVQAVLKRLLAPAPRLLVVAPQPVDGGAPTAVAALAAAQKVAGGAAEQLRAVSFDQLVLGGKPAAVIGTSAIPALEAERVRFADGVELVFKHTGLEKDRVRVQVEVGRGLLGQPRGDAGLWWTAPALLAAGIGPFSMPELARVSAGRAVAFATQGTLSALTFSGATNGANLPAMLKLMTGEITQPRFDTTTVTRVRDSTLATYATTFSQPAGVFQAFGSPALHGGDMRFAGTPTREAIAALTPEAFRRFWTERLAEGPVRVVIVGDVDRARVVDAVGQTLGTLAPRSPPPAETASADVRATPPAAPVVLRHQGDPAQALVLRAFPTPGLMEDLDVSDALPVLDAILQTRLTEGFRATQGATYSPITTNSQSPYLPRYGVVIAGAQVQAARVDGFGRALDATLADLTAKGPSADEFARARATVLSAAVRSREDNGWWTNTLASDLTPARIAALIGYPDRLKAMQPEAIRKIAAHYLTPAHGFTIEVLPAGGTPGTADRTGIDRKTFAPTGP